MSTRLKRVPANFEKKHPGTREYLRPFRAGTGYPFNDEYLFNTRVLV